VIIFWIHFLAKDHNPDPPADLFRTKINVKFFSGIPTFIASYAFQISFFTAFANMKYQKTRNGQLADLFGRLVIFSVYTSIPFIAYSIYGDNMKTNLLKTVVSDKSAFAYVLQSIFLLVSIMAIPPNFFIGKEAVLIIFDEITRRSYSQHNTRMLRRKIKADKKKLIKTINNSEPSMSSSRDDGSIVDVGSMDLTEASTDIEIVLPPEPDPCEYMTMRPVFYYTIVLSLHALTTFLAIYVGDIALFTGVIGATTGCFITFIAPGSFYIICLKKNRLEAQAIAAWFFVFFGIFASIGLNVCVILSQVWSDHYKEEDGF